MLEDDRPVDLEMLIERDPVAGVLEQIGERGLAALDRLPPKVLAVEFDQIESAEHGGVVVLPRRGGQRKPNIPAMQRDLLFGLRELRPARQIAIERIEARFLFVIERAVKILKCRLDGLSGR